MEDKDNKFKALQESADKNKDSYKHKGINSELLESFEFTTYDEFWPSVDIIAPEFTCLCPITGQPDFATIEIVYRPDQLCVESKSLKLYLGSFRNVGSFHETVVKTICEHLTKLLRPRSLKVVGHFQARGGITFRPTCIYNAPQFVNDCDEPEI